MVWETRCNVPKLYFAARHSSLEGLEKFKEERGLARQRTTVGGDGGYKAYTFLILQIFEGPQYFFRIWDLRH